MKLALGLLMFALAACGTEPGPDPTDTTDAGAATLGELTPQELAEALKNKDFLLIDVHVPRAGVIPGTDTSLTYADVDALAAYIGADLERKVVLTCLSDHMSEQAGKALVARGYRAMKHLAGGMNAWKAAGYELDP